MVRAAFLRSSQRTSTHNLYAGTVFDSSVERGQTISFPLAGVIKGWQEGLQLMKEGGKATIICPSDIAYGEAGSGDVIPPGATLKFEGMSFVLSSTIAMWRNLLTFFLQWNCSRSPKLLSESVVRY